MADTTDPNTVTNPDGNQPEGTPPAENKTDWEKAYKGLQTTYNKLKETSDNTIADLTGKLEKNTADLTTFKNQASQFEEQAATLQKTIEDINQKLSTEQATSKQAAENLERARLIISEFPELAKWEADGLLPAASTVEEMRDRFTKFQTNLGSQVGQKVQQKMEGATPDDISTGTSNTSNAPAENEQFLIDEMIKVAAKKPLDEAKYSELQGKYDALVRKKAQASQS